MKLEPKFKKILFISCISILFASICIILIIEIINGNLKKYGVNISRVLAKILIGAVLAYILNPILMIFENWLFVGKDIRKKIRNRQKELKKTNNKMSLIEILDESARLYRESIEEKNSKQIEKPKKNNILTKFFKIKKKQNLHPMRSLSLLCTFLLFGIIVALIAWAIIPQLSDTILDLIKKIEQFINYLPTLSTKLKDSLIYNEIIKYVDVQSEISKISNNLIGILSSFSSSMVSFVTNIYHALYNTFIGIILAIYFLASKELLFEQFSNLINSIFKNRTSNWIRFIISDVDLKFGKFIQGKLLDSSIIAILSLIIMSILAIPYPALLALIIGVTNIIPFFGPIIGAIPCAFIVFISNPSKTILFIVLIILIQQFDGNFLGNFILGDSLELPPVWIMIAIIVMGGLFGFFGMFLGVPTFAVLFTLVREIAKVKKSKKDSENPDYTEHDYESE